MDRGELLERHLRAACAHHQDALQRREILAVVARVADRDRVALTTLDGRRDVHAAERRLDHFRDVAHAQAVTRGGVAVDVDVEVEAAGEAFGERAAGAGHVLDRALDVERGALDAWRGRGRTP